MINTETELKEDTSRSEWYLYLVHRIAEYPPNIYIAITDMIQGSDRYLVTLLSKRVLILNEN